jgi:hypothetical protein
MEGADDQRTTANTSTPLAWKILMLHYEHLPTHTDWPRPSEVEKCIGMTWKEDGGWSCFILISLKAAARKSPIDFEWNSIMPELETLDDRDEESFFGFWEFYMNCFSADEIIRFKYP